MEKKSEESCRKKQNGRVWRGMLLKGRGMTGLLGRVAERTGKKGRTRKEEVK